MRIIMLLAIFVLPLESYAGDGTLTGNARMDLVAMPPSDSVPQSKTVMVQNTVDRSRLKKPILAGAMSLLVPGSGEYYSERYLKTGIFLAVEAAALTAAIYYNNRGNTATTNFQNYANQHWSAVKYAEWINANGTNYEESGTTYPTIDPTAPQPTLFAEINAWEILPHTVGFSHELPTYNTQQYYELIGKYSQFKYGWDTYVDKSGNPLGDDGYDLSFIPQQMLTYAHNRGVANDYYYTAATATIFVVANHFISAIDGAWSASNYNKDVTSSIGMHLQDAGGGEVALVTELTVKISL
ncbi:MAG TPA: hypothetical protein VMF88_06580 [Bacteroidota bacterium]|nr:hypothetical protein [Bacteroidota bacterium]